jgi:uncharacterized protein YqjF (DUF2071 family)
MKQILQKVGHRPWPLPTSSWVMAQQWHDLLFAHWPVAEEILRGHIPLGLELDTFEGAAWLAIVPFRMEGVRLRFAPALPGTSSFPELNVRTYVKRDGKPGVWFFSLDAANALAVAVARAWFHLPYFRADMTCEEREGWIEYQSARTHPGAPPAKLTGRYRGFGDTFRAAPGSLEQFLIERYCLYSAKPNGEILRGEIHHSAWDLQLAEAELTENSMGSEFFAPLHGAPLLHFARRQEVVAWAPQIA